MDKCLHILPMNKLSGAEKMALIMCKNMKNYKPIVVCGGETLKNIFKENNIKSYSLNFSNKNVLKCLKGLRNIIRENNIRIIHAHDNNASLRAYILKKLYGLNIKIVSHIHSCYPFLESRNINKSLDYILRNKYDCNIACGNMVYNFYKNNTKYFDEGKAIILSNSIDLKDVDNFIQSKDLKEMYGIPRDKVVLGFVGRLCKIKGIVDFIKEFAKNKDNLTDCVVLLVGSGEQEDEINLLIKDLGLEEFFILTGFQENSYEFYNIMDIFFISSLYEGLPMVLLESMAFKKSVVSMNVGSIKELIQNNKTGILVDAKDFESLINEIIKLKNNMEFQKVLGDNAFKLIKENYNIEPYIEKLENKYNQLV